MRVLLYFFTAWWSGYDFIIEESPIPITYAWNYLELERLLKVSAKSLQNPFHSAAVCLQHSNSDINVIFLLVCLSPFCHMEVATKVDKPGQTTWSALRLGSFAIFCVCLKDNVFKYCIAIKKSPGFARMASGMVACQCAVSFPRWS